MPGEPGGGDRKITDFSGCILSVCRGFGALLISHSWIFVEFFEGLVNLKCLKPNLFLLKKEGTFTINKCPAVSVVSQLVVYL